MDLLAIGGAMIGPFLPAVISGFLFNRTTAYLAIGCVLAGAAGGVYVTKKFWDASEKTAVTAAANQQEVRFHTVIRVEQVVQERIVRVQAKAKEIVREIPKIITVEVEKACPGGVPVGFVRVHDAAAANQSPAAAALTDARPAGITLAETGTVVADNYEQYHICRQQVIGWNLFYACLWNAQLHADPREAADRCIAAQLPKGER